MPTFPTLCITGKLHYIINHENWLGWSIYFHRYLVPLASGCKGVAVFSERNRLYCGRSQQEEEINPDNVYQNFFYWNTYLFHNISIKTQSQQKLSVFVSDLIKVTVKATNVHSVGVTSLRDHWACMTPFGIITFRNFNCHLLSFHRKTLFVVN